MQRQLASEVGRCPAARGAAVAGFRSLLRKSSLNENPGVGEKELLESTENWSAPEDGSL